MRSFSIIMAFVLAACGGSSAPTQDQIVAACTHLCQCETGTTDTSCHDTCASAMTNGGPTSLSNGSFSSYSSFSSSLSANPFGMLPQACVDCYTAASCATITAGNACATECQ